MENIIIDNINIIGLLATFIGLLRFIPITIEVYKSKKTNNFPYLMLLFAITSTILWLIYSYINNSIPLFISASLAFAVYLFILFIKIKY